jgi:hypothetical protein
MMLEVVSQPRLTPDGGLAGLSNRESERNPRRLRRD